uniref:Uncharacterized protein n=1 Tax=Anguilla anguilla TaxID=7936 RepID=A0A0E9T2H2_ANGAN
MCVYITVLIFKCDTIKKYKKKRYYECVTEYCRLSASSLGYNN